MPAIPGVTIDWVSSPRLIIIPLAIRDVSAQDLIDTLREQECTYAGLDQERLLFEGTGKTSLDESGTKVAITLVLLNAQLYFVPDPVPRQVGTVTSGDPQGKILTDTSALFVTNLVERGDTVYNSSTSGLSSVVDVISETQLEVRPLVGGSPNNEWSIGNSYGIWNNQQCSIAGGNVVAIDDEILQNFISPVLESPNVQIVRTSSASATLQELAAIQYASYQNGITFNQATGQAGTAYPIGTPQYPVNNLADALLISAATGLTRLIITGVASFVTGDSLTGWELEGTNESSHHAHTFGGGVLTDCTFKGLHVSGPLYGQSILVDCRLGSVSSFSGQIHNCLLESGTTTLSASGVAEIIDCAAGTSTTFPSFDCNGTGQAVIRNFNGGLTVKNKTGGAGLSVDLNSGFVVLDSTCTGSTLSIRGVGALTNNSVGMAVSTEGLNVAEHSALLYAIESSRISHRAFGVAYYVDTVNGLDTNDGKSVSSPFLTVAAALTACTSGRSDVIYLTAPAAGIVTISENIIISKEDIHIRGPGRGLLIQPASGVTLTISADNVSLSGLRLKAPVGSTADDVIVLNGANAKLQRLFVIGSGTGTGNGILINGGEYHVFDGLEIEDHGGDGIKFVDASLPSGSPREVTIKDCQIYDNGGNGINITATSAVSTRLIHIENCEILSNGDYGVNIGADVSRTFVDSHSSVYQNVSGQINDLGTLTKVESTSNPWDALTGGNESAGTMGGRLKTIADDVAFIKYIEGGRWKIDTSLKQMIFYKDDNTTEVARFNLKDASGNATSESVFERVRSV